MPHQAETQSQALLPASAASDRRKRLILLCCEDLRPVACALEDALRSRGWQVDVEFGADAKPWVQQVPPVRPSLRVLCVPGTVDPTLAQQLRAAFRPEPEADLHILGVDGSPGLVQEIERLAGVRTPARRSLAAAPRLAHATLVEQQVRSERTWRVAAVSALAAFLVTLGGTSLVEHSARAPELSPTSFATGITSLAAPRPADLDSEAPRMREPVLAAAGPMHLEPLDEPLPEDDDEVVLLDDDTPPEEPRDLEASAITSPAALGRVDVLASPLAAPAAALPITEAITTPAVDMVTITSPRPTLPAGFLPVAGLPISDAAPARRHLPKGFLPVAGMTAPPRVDTIDPFDVTVTVTDAITTVDPFGAAAP